jgi:DNA-binding NarL/FixJ family response regulator
MGLLNLTERQEKIIKELRQGKDYKEISKKLCISVNTIRKHLCNARQANKCSTNELIVNTNNKNSKDLQKELIDIEQEIIKLKVKLSRINKKLNITEKVYITNKEKEVFILLAEGKKLKDITKILNITENTTKKHIQNAKNKNNYSKAELMIYCKD